jgi:predicted dehydrogenase
VLRVGLVGCGGRGTGAALQALSAEQGTVVLTAMADVFPERVDHALETLRTELKETADARLQVPPEQRFAGFDAAARLMATDVHVVLLATPPHFRPAHLQAAVAAGKHVFCEKPMAVDVPGLRSVMETARPRA